MTYKALPPRGMWGMQQIGVIPGGNKCRYNALLMQPKLTEEK